MGQPFRSQVGSLKQSGVGCLGGTAYLSGALSCFWVSWLVAIPELLASILTIWLLACPCSHGNGRIPKENKSKQGLLRPRLGTGTPRFCHILLAKSQAPPRFKRWGDRSHFLTVKLRSHYEGYQYKEKGSTGAICTIKNPKPINSLQLIFHIIFSV